MSYKFNIFTGALDIVNDADDTKNAVYDKIQTIGGSTQSKSFVITNPTVASDLPLWRAPAAITISAVHLLCQGNVVVGQAQEYDSNGLNPTPVDASDITGIVNTNVNDDGSLTNPGIASGNYLGWATSSVTGSPTYAIITIDYTVD
jgi:hypothetical protein